MPWPRWSGPAIGLALYALAVAARLPFLDAPSYGDEGLHYWTARHLGGRLDVVTDLLGRDFGGAPHLVLQRPLFYLLAWLPAQAGFASFRTAVSLGTAVLAPLAYGLLRAHGGSRPAALLAGAAVATWPSLVLWGNLALMDAAMTAWLLGALWARAAGRPLLAAVLGVAAAWTKETAIPLLAMLVIHDVVQAASQARRGGEPVSLLPLRLPAMPSSSLWALLVGALPVLAFQVLDLVRIGGMSADPTEGVLDRLVGTPWLLLFLVPGLLLPRSRFLCGAALAAAAFMLVWHVSGRGVPGWYNVPATTLALVGSASAVDAWVRHSSWSSRTSWTAPVPAAALVVLSLAVVFADPGPSRAWLQPFTSDGGDDLEGTAWYETQIRDQDYLAAVASVQSDAVAIVGVDIYPPRLMVPFEAHAGAIVQVWTPAHEVFPLGFDLVADHMEANGTWTVLELKETAMSRAIRDTYADCRVAAGGSYETYRADGCRGRQERLEWSWREHHPDY